MSTSGPSVIAQSPSLNGWAGAFASFLVNQQVIERGVADRAGSASEKSGERFDRVLTKLGLLSEGDLATALSTFMGLALVRPIDLPPSPLLVEAIEADFVRYNRVMPLSFGEDSIVVGVVDPLTPDPVESLAYLTGLAVETRIFIPADFERAFDALYSKEVKESEDGADGQIDANEFDIQRLRDIASEAPTIRLVNQIIVDAVEARASDIHLEPNVEQIVVRYRIDGVLCVVRLLDSSLRAAVVSRIKIMSKLDIAERRMPQDGRTKLAVRGVDIDFRVSTIPTNFGESVVMRILDRARVELDFSKLGFEPEQIAALKRLAGEPNGLILVTGPTGSGKTTTLYTLLKALNTPDRKVFTVEDPIEYQIPGISQVQVQPSIGLDFPHALRSILRQDPDIIMIGEIRDLETAQIAIQSALTGHLVISTLHTNSASSAVTRLIDMGIESYLLASTVKGIVAQRLVRTLCQRCSGPHGSAVQWEAELVREMPQIRSLEAANIRQPHGCDVCGRTGFVGRSSIAEVLLIGAEFHRLILSRASEKEIEAVARDQAMKSMYEWGAAKVWRGETTIEEVLRATRVG